MEILESSIRSAGQLNILLRGSVIQNLVPSIIIFKILISSRISKNIWSTAEKGTNIVTKIYINLAFKDIRILKSRMFIFRILSCQIFYVQNIISLPQHFHSAENAVYTQLNLISKRNTRNCGINHHLYHRGFNNEINWHDSRF